MTQKTAQHPTQEKVHLLYNYMYTFQGKMADQSQRLHHQSVQHLQQKKLIMINNKQLTYFHSIKHIHI